MFCDGKYNNFKRHYKVEDINKAFPLSDRSNKMTTLAPQKFERDTTIPDSFHIACGSS